VPWLSFAGGETFWDNKKLENCCYLLFSFSFLFGIVSVRQRKRARKRAKIKTAVFEIRKQLFWDFFFFQKH